MLHKASWGRNWWNPEDTELCTGEQFKEANVSLDEMMQKGLFNVYNFDGGAHEETEKAYTLRAGLQEEREGSYSHTTSFYIC